jgi:hypothetical protein
MKKFEDSLNTAVFTSKFVIRENKPITYVTHDEEDGAWQFHSNDDWENYEDVAMIVGLGEVIKRDSTVLEVADLPYGYIATRASINDNWVVQKREPNEEEE